jgi:O-antigen ligase
MSVKKAYPEIFSNLKWGIMSLVAFSMPLLPQITPVFVVLLLLSWIAEGGFKEKIVLLRSNKMALFLIALYLLFGFSFIWSNDKPSAIADFDIKLSMLAFPLVLLSINAEEGKMEKILNAFISGCLLALMALWAYAFYRYWLFSEPDVFYYARFSVHLHPSYFSLYLNLALVPLVFTLTKAQSKLGSVKILVAILFIVAGILMMSSKSGILSMAISIGLSAFFFAGRKWLLAALAGLAIFSVVAIGLSETLRARLSDLPGIGSSASIDKNTSSSSGIRLLIWEASMDLIKENPIFGVGGGDVKEKLNQKFEERGMDGAKEARYNSHNQYLQTAIALGIVGFVLLMACLVIPLISAIKQRNWLLLIFSILILFNLLTESILERQAGITFFAFFVCLFMMKEKSSSPSHTPLVG